MASKWNKVSIGRIFWMVNKITKLNQDNLIIIPTIHLWRGAIDIFVIILNNMAYTITSLGRLVIIPIIKIMDIIVWVKKYLRADSDLYLHFFPKIKGINEIVLISIMSQISSHKFVFTPK